MDLVNQMMQKSDELLPTLATLSDYGIELAQTERIYKLALNKKSLEMKAKGTTATLINKIIYGEKDIADLRFNRDVAETMRTTAQERINILKLQMRILDNQIAREWSIIKR
jgi:hypothetical protein